MKICPRCSQPNNDMDPICRRCGLPLTMQGDPAAQQFAAGYPVVPHAGSPQLSEGLRSAADQNPSEVKTKNAAEKKFSTDPAPGNKQKTGEKSSSGDSSHRRKTGTAVSFWQVLSAVCLLGILLIMIYKTFGSDISSFVRKTVRKITPPQASTVVTNQEDEDVTVEDLFAETAKESDPLFDKIGAFAEQGGMRNFDDLDLDELLKDENAESRFRWDVQHALSSSSTSLTHKKRMQELIGNYYRIDGTVEDVYSNGRVKIKSGTEYSYAGLSVYGFSEEQLLKYTKNDRISIIVKIIYADSIDGNDESYYMAGLYVQDKP